MVFQTLDIFISESLEISFQISSLDKYLYMILLSYARYEDLIYFRRGPIHYLSLLPTGVTIPDRGGACG